MLRVKSDDCGWCADVVNVTEHRKEGWCNELVTRGPGRAVCLHGGHSGSVAHNSASIGLAGLSGGSRQVT